ncbi:hypothetical protein GC207_02140 [bacterium]|nr:hypothetical protein [bacterium]
MKIPRTQLARRLQNGSAVTLTSTLIAMALLGIMTTVALMVISSAIFTIQLARENDRATQVLIEKTESIRLYNWDQINSNGFIPPTFSVAYDPNAATNQGVNYNGTIDISPAPISSSYSNDLLSVVVRVSWQTGNLQRTRELTTLVSRYGLESYIY